MMLTKRCHHEVGLETGVECMDSEAAEAVEVPVEEEAVEYHGF